MEKRQGAFAAVCAVAILGFFFAMGYRSRQTIYEPENISAAPLSENDMTLWTVNDMHYLAPELKDEGEAFGLIQETAAGKDLVYQEEAMQALVWAVQDEQPDYVIVNGDLTLNGELRSAEKLAEYFKQMEQGGTEVLINPGNHDISNGWARQFSGSEQIKVPSLGPREYKELYAEFGYDVAAFQDSHSLSYVAAVRSDYWIVMLDANQYAPRTGKGPAPSGGRLREETISWLKDVVKEAEKAGARLLPVMHHNAVLHNSVVRDNYAIANGEQLFQLLAESSTPVMLTAHVHAQNIIEYTTDGHTLYDIATGAMSIYPSSIGSVHVSEEGLHYQRIVNPVEEWAQEMGNLNPDVLEYRAYLRELFVEDGRAFGESSVFGEEWKDTSRVEEVMDFVGEANVRFFSGEDYVGKEEWEDRLTELHNLSIYRHIKEQSSGRLLRYLDSVLMDGNMEDTEFFYPFNSK